MLNIKQIKYEINPIEFNEAGDEYHWRSHTADAWLGLSELQGTPSLFIQLECCKAAIPIQDLEKLLAMPIVQKLLNQADLK